MRNRISIDIDLLKSLLDFSIETGLFTWKKQRPKCRIGNVAGYKNGTGYINIDLLGVVYPAHRLAWFYVYGTPEFKEIDHINMIRHDNRICNLREVTRAQNVQNTKPRSESGLKGITKACSSGKWIATIKINGSCIYLGTFDDKYIAYETWLNAAKKHGHINYIGKERS